MEFVWFLLGLSCASFGEVKRQDPPMHRHTEKCGYELWKPCDHIAMVVHPNCSFGTAQCVICMATYVSDGRPTIFIVQGTGEKR